MICSGNLQIFCVAKSEMMVKVFWITHSDKRTQPALDFHDVTAYQMGRTRAACVRRVMNINLLCAASGGQDATNAYNVITRAD